MHAQRSPQRVSQARMADHLTGIAALPDDYWWHLHRFNLVADALASTRPQGGALLDFGCGAGGFLKLASRSPKTAHWTLAGFDVERRVIETQRATMPKGLTLASDAAALTPPYDAVVMLDVLEHVQDDLGLLKSAVHLAGRGAVFCITVPAGGLFWSRWDQTLGHFRRYDPTALRRLVAAAGLVPVRAGYFFSFLCLPALWRRLRHPARPQTTGDAGQPDPGSVEFPKVPPAVNACLNLAAGIERWAWGKVPMPFGTSLLMVARHEQRDRA